MTVLLHTNTHIYISLNHKCKYEVKEDKPFTDRFLFSFLFWILKNSVIIVVSQEYLLYELRTSHLFSSKISLIERFTSLTI